MTLLLVHCLGLEAASLFSTALANFSKRFAYFSRIKETIVYFPRSDLFADLESAR
jgi:hypothetical protein